jgi:hypothetical protein
MEITLMEVGAKVKTPKQVLNSLLRFPYDQERGTGFSELDIENDRFVSGFAVKKSPVFIKVFDPTSLSMVEREESVIHEVFFKIDTIGRLIEIYATSRDVKRLMTVFAETLGDTVALESLNFTAYQILDSFRRSDKSFEIIKMGIKDFESEKGVIGNYDIRAVKPDVAWKLIDRYQGNVTTATASFVDVDLEGSIQVFQQAKFKLAVKPRTSAEIVVELIKTVVFEMRGR